MCHIWCHCHQLHGKKCCTRIWHISLNKYSCHITNTLTSHISIKDLIFYTECSNTTNCNLHFSLLPNICHKDICTPNLAYMPHMPNIYWACMRDVYACMCYIWSQWHQPRDKEHCTWTKTAPTTPLTLLIPLSNCVGWVVTLRWNVSVLVSNEKRC